MAGSFAIACHPSVPSQSGRNAAGGRGAAGDEAVVGDATGEGAEATGGAGAGAEQAESASAKSSALLRTIRRRWGDRLSDLLVELAAQALHLGRERLLARLGHGAALLFMNLERVQSAIVTVDDLVVQMGSEGAASVA